MDLPIIFVVELPVPWRVCREIENAPSSIRPKEPLTGCIDLAVAAFNLRTRAACHAVRQTQGTQAARAWPAMRLGFFTSHLGMRGP